MQVQSKCMGTRNSIEGQASSRPNSASSLMSTDLAAEADFFDMAPEGVAVHITRLKTDDYTTNETLVAAHRLHG